MIADGTQMVETRSNGVIETVKFLLHILRDGLNHADADVAVAVGCDYLDSGAFNFEAVVLDEVKHSGNR